MTPALSKFVKIIGELERSKHRSEIFWDFCELAYCALAKRASPFADQQDKLEAQYMEVVGRYKTKDDVRRMPELLALTMQQLSVGGCDFLGMAAGELGVLDGQMGQFFTPYEVSRLMADINLSGIEDKIRANGFVTLQEPAAGAGGMLIAVADKIEALGFNLETSLWIEAVELSRPTFHMCYIQCAARGLSGRIVNGNSLTLEAHTSALTAGAAHFYAAHGEPSAKQRKDAAERAAQDQQDKDRAAKERAQGLRDLAEAPPITGEQMSFF